MEYRAAPKKKKVKKRPYSILIQKSKGSSGLDEQKVKNIAIEYRLQSIFPNPASNKQFFAQKISTGMSVYRAKNKPASLLVS